MAELAQGPIPNFLMRVSNNWNLTFVYPKIWAIKFTVAPRQTEKKEGDTNKVMTLQDSIKNALKRWGDQNGYASIMGKNNIYADLLSNSESNYHVDVGAFNEAKHFILANKVTIPQESVTIMTSGRPNNEFGSGAISGRIGATRYNDVNRSVDITFLDTYGEFTECIIKPWIIAVANQGLIESSDLGSLKCNIEAFFFAKAAPSTSVSAPPLNYNGSNDADGNYEVLKNEHTVLNTVITNLDPTDGTWSDTYAEKVTDNRAISILNGPVGPYLRKKIVFHNCVPVNMPAKNYNYAPEIGNDEAMTTIKFNYDYYEIERLNTDTMHAKKIVSNSNSPEGRNTYEIDERGDMQHISSTKYMS